jgi:hypothetical protein
MRGQPLHQSISVFSLRGNYGSPLFQYTGSSLVQRWDCLWPVLGFLKQEAEKAGLSLQNVQDSSFFRESIADDLHRQKPSLVFIDQKDSELDKWGKHFDYLRYFSQNERFRQEWKSYHYLTTLKGYPFYIFKVYERSAVPANRS